MNLGGTLFTAHRSLEHKHCHPTDFRALRPVWPPGASPPSPVSWEQAALPRGDPVRDKGQSLSGVPSTEPEVPARYKAAHPVATAIITAALRACARQRAVGGAQPGSSPASGVWALMELAAKPGSSHRQESGLGWTGCLGTTQKMG